MSDQILSQEEIEALLRGESLTGKESFPSAIQTKDCLNELETDALGEIGNISIGSSATALSALLGQKVDITTPHIELVNTEILEKEFIHPYVVVKVNYTEGLSGMNLLVVEKSDAAIIVDLMLGGNGLSPNMELGEIHLSAVQEAMNQMMGSAATSMSMVFNKRVDISPPTVDLVNVPDDQVKDHLDHDELYIKVAFSLKIGELIDSTIMQLLPLDFGKKLVASLMEGTSETESAVTREMSEPVKTNGTIDPSPIGSHQQVEQEQTERQTHAVENHLSHGQAAIREQQRPSKQPIHVQQAQFASFDQPALSQNESNNLNMLLDIPLQVTVELGRTTRSVKEILEMSSGSIIELDKLAGEPVDILVNNRHIAKGEVVVIDENFGVRITDILSQTERLNNLK
ncbi:flagellar motor switch phosphatase FliY [Sporosarcina sp. HYO08]|uniref:flagellar motor switch phosphatase FliY n=1 Tax=Sporosarcina sp. HYO08 TaxID=1759557 RepID=UPI000793BFEB|nr:flagellar motor switch phosphatase FliY [Sporosarcina sp. HYO08]KXH79990.1 flagellar motor switch protein FliN [Sporosarcina sp. HYO08]